MKCADPTLCYTTEKGSRQFRHFSLANDLFKQMAQLVFNCGKCIHCRKKKAFELACRCVLHASMYEDNCFLTLTYDENKKGYHNGFKYSDIQKFKKRLRSYCKRNTGKRIEVFNVHEYGRNRKKHWHLVIFNWSPRDRTLFTQRNSIPYYSSDVITKLWRYGFHCVGDVTEASAMYQSQYMEKDFRNRNETSEKYKSHSKHSGIGKPYFYANYSQILKLGYIPFGGKKMPLPRYFEKIAKRHHAHYYEPGLFYPTRDRKATFRPFGPKDKPIREIADLYVHFRSLKDSHIRELEKKWDEVILQYLTTKDKPDFIKSAENTLYDLRNKQQHERF